MREKVDIGPTKLKAEIDRGMQDIPQDQDLEAFLLQSPTFSQKQLDTIAETRKGINQWRSKPSDYKGIFPSEMADKMQNYIRQAGQE